MSLTAGCQLGPYEILEPIGKGGMGEVWKARDTRLNRMVAIKQLLGQHNARFQQEARAIAALNHPHICTLHDVGPDYLVMEFVEGKTLRGPLPTEEAVRLAVQMAGALEAAHRKRIIHRDLKPTNVMITETGVKLLDFGLAKLTEPGDDDATRTVEGTLVGTVAYMSPEQAQGKPLDERSDIFSFGAVLHEMVSGARAFPGESTAEVISAVLRDEPRAVDAPAELAAIIQRCLQKAPAGRFASMLEVRTALEKVKLGEASQSSIAVLPFANMSRDPDDEFFSDGLAEEIINALVKVPGLKVIARTSAFAFKGQNTDIRKIAEILGVGNVLEGSVRRSGHRIRVTAQLITAADGSHLWSERYDREMTDVFAIQDEIAAAIAGAMQLKLSAAAAPRRTPRLPAYEAYLKYRHYQWGFTPEALQRSKECLEQALALDPRFALPYVGLADYHLASAAVGAKPAREAMPRARDLAQRALELDPDLAEAHAMLGIVAGHYDFDWRENDRRFRLALAREPISCHLRQWHSLFHLSALGQAEEALRQLDRVLEEDPLSQMWHWTRSNVLKSLGRDDEALAANRRACELDPQFWLGRTFLGLHLALRGSHTEARECIEKGAAAAPWCPINVGLLAGALENTGESERAGALLAQLRSAAHGSGIGLAYYHLVRGEIDHAAESAGKAAEERFPGILTILIRPFEAQFRQSRGWPALLKKLNLPGA
ncbi:MAG: protein kinase [Acidobacteriia bacterium]|nr:protein kinase [Terriglobia bacterium]